MTHDNDTALNNRIYRIGMILLRSFAIALCGTWALALVLRADDVVVMDAARTVVHVLLACGVAAIIGGEVLARSMAD